MLHILRHSPRSDGRFASCLRVLAGEDGVLLTEEAVYALLRDSATAAQLNLVPAAVQFYVLEADVLARGLPLDDLPARVEVIDYQGMVAICAKFPKVVSW
ncbi:sulfurtransferase complex subunit TusB [Pseudomonas sp. NyZ704]|nr:sulfurtransferase complex subunit TusB [Pseudomonas sp. NyZ704]